MDNEGALRSHIMPEEVMNETMALLDVVTDFNNTICYGMVSQVLTSLVHTPFLADEPISCQTSVSSSSGFPTHPPFRLWISQTERAAS
jgi:hypothetical protein